MLAAWALIVASVPAIAANDDWSRFKQSFVQAEGRVIDTGQNGITHSEAQGIGMLLAVMHDDRASFDAIWKWTRRNLQIREDHLLAWRWSDKDGVSDRNNATDGDLYIAWALLRAHARWSSTGYGDEAKAILRDVRAKLILHGRRGAILLPGAEGFSKPEGITVNLSYWLFPAFDDFERALPDPVWNDLARTGVNLLLEAHFGRWGLPADWITLGDKLAPADGFPSRFGYDAVRIPLYLMWSGLANPELMTPFQNYWRHFEGAKFVPAWTRLDDDSIDSHDAPAGMHAIAGLTLAYPDTRLARIPGLTAGDNYYSATLLLLSRNLAKQNHAE